MSMCQGVVVLRALPLPSCVTRGLPPEFPCRPTTRGFLLAARALSPLSTARLSPVSMPSWSWPAGSNHSITHS
eukprot:3809227-Pyramimonas_sp.AAC.1